jgi:hypothetical protein
MQEFKILEEMQAQETLFGLSYNERREDKRRSGYPKPLLGRFFFGVLWPQMGNTSHFLVKTCRKSTNKACWKYYKTTRKL